MANLSKQRLVDILAQSITDADWNVLYPTGKGHPLDLLIYRDDDYFRLSVYIWNLTHGGGPARPKNEYRIQITGIRNFERKEGVRTLILGWWNEVGVFAGFDVRKHLGRIGYSPSIQIREESLRQAYVNGFAPCDKGNHELAIAFRPDFIIEYIRNLESLHDFGESAEEVTALETVAINPNIVNDVQITIQSNSRRVALTQVSRKLREVGFRNRVLTAYGFRCAVCGLQMNLVEAAHLIPASHEVSTDETSNGISLCALHHKAFDRNLITITDDYSIILNDKLIQNLRRERKVEGLDTFKSNLRKMIILPPSIPDRPHTEYIRIANEIRGWLK